MTIDEQREASRKFIMKWRGRGKEDEDDRSYWLDIFQRILGAEDATDRILFQKKVLIQGHTKRIDAYVPETQVLIEQKSLGIALDKRYHNSDDVDLTPYEQAKRYNDNLPFAEKARYIVTCNFSQIWIYDMNQRDPESKIEKIHIEDLQRDFYRLNFLIKREDTKISKEMKVSMQAGQIVGNLYDELYKNYVNQNEDTLKSLNVLCVRLVFCMFAEDAGLFERKDMFHDYLQDIEPKKIRSALKDLFRILDTPENEREADEEEELLAFPYVNGGLFSDVNIKIPQFTDKLKDILLKKASRDFDWSEISPTIFGAIFESTLNPQTRRSGGMHYTSLENIHKVIDPLFLDDLKQEFEECSSKSNVGGSRTKALQKFQDKLASLRFLDPAAGSGNFLTESYTSLRKLENKVLRELMQDVISGQMGLDIVNAEEMFDIKVSIQQFYGIEINDFAVTVAKTALWIAEAQMMRETLVFADIDADYLPLKPYVNIVEANALRIDWNEVLPSIECDYIMGNPPFVSQGGESDRGQRHDGAGRNKTQSEDLKLIFQNERGTGNLDYVACWYRKAYKYMKENSFIHAAFVSTNSICQGQQVRPLWKYLFENGLEIEFAHQSFIWDSASNKSATVYVVIIGFSFSKNNKSKKLYCYNIYRGIPELHQVNHINAYLLGDAPDIFVDSRNTPICEGASKMVRGGGASDWGYLLLSEQEKDEMISKDNKIRRWIRPFMQGNEFLKGIKKYCLWFDGISPEELRSLKIVRERLEGVKLKRLKSKKQSTRKKAETPWLFDEIIKVTEPYYIAIPQISAGTRRYIPIGYVSSEVIAGNKLFMIPKGSLYDFGILCSNVHNAWTRVVASHYGPSYQYSAKIAYNNFPWPDPTNEQRKEVEQTAQMILNAREQFPGASLVDLYDSLVMPQGLKKAHDRNNLAVMRAYGFNVKEMSESDCVAELMKMYLEKVGHTN